MTSHKLADIQKNSFFWLFMHIYSKIAVCALASVILNLKLFEFLLLDGPPPRFHQQRRHTYFLRSHVDLLFLYRKSVQKILCNL